MAEDPVDAFIERIEKTAKHYVPAGTDPLDNDRAIAVAYRSELAFWRLRQQKTADVQANNEFVRRIRNIEFMTSLALGKNEIAIGDEVPLPADLFDDVSTQQRDWAIQSFVRPRSVALSNMRGKTKVPFWSWFMNQQRYITISYRYNEAIDEHPHTLTVVEAPDFDVMKGDELP